jgi:hypothetical protein
MHALTFELLLLATFLVHPLENEFDSVSVKESIIPEGFMKAHGASI